MPKRIQNIAALLRRRLLMFTFHRPWFLRSGIRQPLRAHLHRERRTRGGQRIPRMELSSAVHAVNHCVPH